MPKILIFRFKNIPSETTLSVFCKEDEKFAETRTIEPGTTQFELNIPDEGSFFLSLTTTHYFITDYYRDIEDDEQVIEYTGSNYYLDVDREALNEELNQQSVETLTHTAQRSARLDGRQQFYVALVSLQSYFEHLMYGMLVTSGHMSRTAFRRLDYENSMKTAFSYENLKFFDTNITIAPGKGGLGQDMPIDFRDKLKLMMEEIHVLRNKVVHGWGFEDVSRAELLTVFQILEIRCDITGNHDAFYSRCSTYLISLYARTGGLRNQLSILQEKHAIEQDRIKRGV